MYVYREDEYMHKRMLRALVLGVLLAVLAVVRPATAEAAALNGVDISGWNTNINYNKLGDFVIVKATEYNPKKKNYTSYNDYQAQADAALKAGKLIGFYHFGTNPKRGATIKQQAQGFIDAVSVKDSKGNYKYLGRAVLCLDWENTDYSDVESHVAWAKEWLDYVYEKTGVRPVIYTSKTVTNTYNWSSVAKAGYKLWGAMWLYKYDGMSGFVSNPSCTEYGAWGPWGNRPTIYQYASSTTLHNNKIYDVNKFYGTKQDWLEMAYAGELPDGAYDATKLLEDGAIYSFSPTIDTATGLPVANVSNNAVMGGSTGLSYLSGYWKVRNHGDGTYSFVSMSNGKMLSYASGAASGGNVNLTSAVSVWKVVKCSNGALALVPTHNKALRLDVAGGKSGVSGTNVRLYRGNRTPAQRFFFTKVKGLNEAQQAGKVLEEGTYSIASGLDSTKVIDIKGGSTAKGANVQLYKSNNTLAQRYDLIYKGNGLYTIKSHKSGMSLDVKGGSKTKGANVQQYTGNTTLAQLWYLKKVGSNYSICSALSGLALDAAGGKSDNGTNIQIYTANGTKAQQFVLIEEVGLTEAAAAGKVFDDGLYRIDLTAQAGMSVSVAESSANGANVSAAATERTRAQKFELVYQGNGLYLIRSQYALKVLDVKGGSRASGANVQQWGSNGSIAQLWYFVKDGAGYQLRSAQSGNALSLEGDACDAGANLCVMTPGMSALTQALSFQKAQLVDDGTYTMASLLADGLTLSASVATPVRGTNVQLGAETGDDTVRWVITHTGDGVYLIAHAQTGLVLDVKGGSSDKGANVQLWTYNGSDAQKWRLSANSKGGLVLTNVKSGLVLDVAGGSKVAGANIQQWRSNGSVAQGFVEHAVSKVVESAAAPSGAPSASADAAEVVEPDQTEAQASDAALAPEVQEPAAPAGEGATPDETAPVDSVGAAAEAPLESGVSESNEYPNE